MYAYVFADSATIDAPVRIPVRSVAWSFFTFMATLFSTTCELLSIGDLTVNERAPSPQRTARATTGTYPSCLSAQLVLRTQARRKEKGPRSTPLLARPYNDGEPRGRPQGSPLHTSPRPPLQ